MSTAHDERERSQEVLSGRIRHLVRLVAVLAAGASLAVLWLSERARLDHDLQLIAESAARPGETLAVRALLLAHLENASGPELALAPVRLRLLDDAERLLAETTLAPQEATQSMEGELRLPGASRGSLWLDAQVQLADGSTLACRRSLTVSADAPRLVARPRAAGPLQTLAVRDVRRAGAGTLPPPSPLMPHVLGGACPPEVSCSIVVWVGEPASSVKARLSPEIGVPPPREARRAEPWETAGFVSLEIIPYGLEAQLTLEAYRQSQLVAERTLRLPVGLGEVGVSVGEPLLAPDQPLELGLALPPGRDHAIVDVFVAGRWTASRSVPVVPGRSVVLAPELVPPGVLTRIQARTDRFSSDGAGTRLVYRRASGETDEGALSTLALQAEAQSALTPPSGSRRDRALGVPLPAFAMADPQRAAAYLLAPLERLRVALPEAYSARPGQIESLERKRAFLRFGVAGVLVLAASVLAVSMMQRGLSAAREARAILEEAREVGRGLTDEGTSAQSTRLGVILLVLAVVLAFFAAALLIVAKPLWF